MLIRALCLALLLVVPISPRTGTACCGPASSCCKSDHPHCPMSPNGTCTLAAPDQTVATVTRVPDQLPPLPPQPIAFTDVVTPPADERQSLASPHPPPL